MNLSAIILLFFATTIVALAQSAGWHLNLDTDIYKPSISPDGRHLMYFTDDDQELVTCVEVASGRKLWSKALKAPTTFQIGQFIGNDTMLIAQENHYVFLNVSDGSVYASLPIIGKDWGDIRWETGAGRGNDTLRPYFRDSFAIFYFDDGMQIIDLTTPAIIHQTSPPPTEVRYDTWGDMLMINPISGADSIYLIDVKKKKVIYTASKQQSEINSRAYKPFAISASELILFNEDDIQSIDLSTGKQDAIIDVDPSDPDFYTPVIFRKGLYLLVSDENIQKLYNTKDGKILWQTAAGEVPGIVEQVVELPNDEALMMAYDDDGGMTTYKIDATTGKILWSRKLFIQDGSFAPGHLRENKLVATIFAILGSSDVSNSPGSNGRWEYNSNTGMNEHIPTGYTGLHGNPKDIQRANASYDSLFNRYKSSKGYAHTLATNDSQMVLAMAGKIYATSESDDDYDGEGIITLNLNDGSVATMVPGAMLSKSDAKRFNALEDLNIRKLDSAQALIGTHDIYIVRGSAVEAHAFGDAPITFINASADAITFQVNHDDDYYDYWQIDASVTPSRKMLIARSTYPNLVFLDSTAAEISLYINSDSMTAYRPIIGEPTAASFMSPVWKLSDDDIDDWALRVPRKVDFRNRLQGIAVRRSDVLLMGDNKMGIISGDGSCRWAEEWHGNPNPWKLKLGMTEVGYGLIYSTNDEVQILDSRCPMKTIASHDIDTDDAVILIKGDDVVVIDTDEGIIHGYSLR